MGVVSCADPATCQAIAEFQREFALTVVEGGIYLITALVIALHIYQYVSKKRNTSKE